MVYIPVDIEEAVKRECRRRYSEIPLKPTQELNEFARYLRPLKNYIQVLSIAIKTKKNKRNLWVKGYLCGKRCILCKQQNFVRFPENILRL